MTPGEGLSQRLFRALLRLFPSEYRAGYGREMELLFRDQLASVAGSPLGLARLWLRTLSRLPVSLIRVHGSGVARDVHYSLRSIVRNPGFSTVTIVTLGLGIGSATAVFSVANGVLLRPLPYPDPERIVSIWAGNDARPGDLLSVSPPELRDLQEDVEALGAVSGVWRGTITVSDAEPMEQVQYGWATHELPEVLGFDMYLGRWFETAEESPDRKDVVVLSYDYWERQYGGDMGILGRTMVLGPDPARIIGVLPPTFREVFDAGADVDPGVDIWVPQYLWHPDRNSRWLRAIGRLAPEVSIEAARAELGATAADWRRSHEDYAATGVDLTAVSLHDEVTGDVRRSILVLLGAVGFVLAIAYANVANLLLARNRHRAAEFALRMELGAGRGRIARQIFTENVTLAVLGGFVGVLLSVLGVELLGRLRPTNLPRITDVQVDVTVLLAAFGLSVLTGLLVGLVPALSATRTNLQESLQKEGRNTRRTSGGWIRGGLVSFQVSVALVLLIGAGLLGRTFVSLQRTDMGFEPTDVLTVRVPLAPERYPTNEGYGNFYLQLMSTVRELEGVTAVAGVSALPFSGGGMRGPFAWDAATEATYGTFTADYRSVTPGYFEVMGSTLIEGRDFDPNEMTDGRRRVIVDESLARSAWQGRSAIGRHILLPKLGFGPGVENAEQVEVIGVVRHIRQLDVRSNGFPQIYLPVWDLRSAEVALVARASAMDPAVASQIKAAIESMGSGRAVHTVRTMDSFVDDATAESTFALALTSLFAALALVVASVGIYGAISFEVASRRREIGIRLALGAEREDVLLMTLRRGLVLTLIGVVAGAGGARALTRVLESLLFGVGPSDPATFVSMGALFLMVGAAACWLPADRAARVDPLRAID